MYAGMRRLLFLASAMIFFDVAFFAAIAPLLPQYVDELGLTKAEAGILSAAYAAGTLLASLPAGFVASRMGPRRTVIMGLLLLGCSSVVFGFADQIYLLDGARFVQGIAGALIWSGALTWLITTAPEENRGSVIGTALGTAVAGALLGPALGAIAGSIGTEIVFSSVLLVTILLSLGAASLPETTPPEEQNLGEVMAILRSRPVLEAAAFVAVPSVMFGAIEVLVPLRIDDAYTLVDFQSVFDRVYDEAGYAHLIAYDGEPEPPLSKSDADWVAERLREQAAQQSD